MKKKLIIVAAFIAVVLACSKEKLVLPSEHTEPKVEEKNKEIQFKNSQTVYVSDYEWAGFAHNYAVTEAIKNHDFSKLSFEEKIMVTSNYFEEYAQTIDPTYQTERFSNSAYETMYSKLQMLGGSMYFDLVVSTLSKDEKRIMSKFLLLTDAYESHQDANLFMEGVRILEGSIVQDNYNEILNTGVRQEFMRAGLAMARHSFILWKEGNDVIDITMVPPGDGNWKADVGGFFDIDPPRRNCICIGRRWESGSNASYINNKYK